MIVCVENVAIRSRIFRQAKLVLFLRLRVLLTVILVIEVGFGVLLKAKRTEMSYICKNDYCEQQN